jgi:hypothetical protein
VKDKWILRRVVQVNIFAHNIITDFHPLYRISSGDITDEKKGQGVSGA